MTHSVELLKRRPLTLICTWRHLVGYPTKCYAIINMATIRGAKRCFLLVLHFNLTKSIEYVNFAKVLTIGKALKCLNYTGDRIHATICSTVETTEIGTKAHFITIRRLLWSRNYRSTSQTTPGTYSYLTYLGSFPVLSSFCLWERQYTFSQWV
jgi:hypothetical protein